MSDFHAIGAVSATIRTLLEDRMELPDSIPNVRVTVGPPVFSSKDADPRKEDPRVSVFLYRVTENGHLQNQEIPGAGSRGAFGHPPLSLNLHYLLTAYGNQEINVNGSTPIFDETDAQYLLGSAMRVLHDISVVTENLGTVRAPSGRSILHERLHDAFEQIKLSIEPLSLEDISKIWTALALRYRLSTAYVVNVVQIESQRQRHFPRPVGQPISPTVPPRPDDTPGPGPMVQVIQMQVPTISGMTVRRANETAEHPFPYARLGDTLILRGSALNGPNVTVNIGGTSFPADLTRADRVEVTLRDDALADGTPIPPDQRLQSGVRSARIVVSDPSTPQRRLTSNDVAFMLVPSVDASSITAGLTPRTVTFSGTRLTTPDPQDGETVIGLAIIPRSAYINPSPTSVTVLLPDTLPASDAQALVSEPLPAQVPLTAGSQQMEVTIGGEVHTITANLTSPIDRSALPGHLARLLHDINGASHAYRDARVSLWDDRLVVLPGGLVSPITINAANSSSFADDLGLLATQPPGASSASVSGVLTTVPAFSSPAPRLTMKIGSAPTVTINLPPATSLEDLAAKLQAAITGSSTSAEYANALVAVTGDHLLVIPGTGDPIVFGATDDDSSTVAELQLHLHVPLRVRVNGAESIEPASVEVPL